MDVRYTEIWIAQTSYKDEVDDDTILLTNDNNINHSFDVDLRSDCFFNEWHIDKVFRKYKVNSLENVYEFCRNNDITIKKNRIVNEGLIVGGEEDFLIDNNLNGNWIPNQVKDMERLFDTDAKDQPYGGAFSSWDDYWHWREG